MGTANAFLAEYMDKHNERFADEPGNPEDAHRPVLHNGDELDLMFRTHHERTISRNLTIRFRSHAYRILGQDKGYRLRGKKVTMREAFDGSVAVAYKGKRSRVELLAPGEPCVPVHHGKNARQAVGDAKVRQARTPRRRPPVDHPWR